MSTNTKEEKVVSEDLKQNFKSAKESKKSSKMLGYFDISSLTERELKYFRLMYATEGVLYIKGEPGKAKSAILNSIAKKLDLYFIDLRLSQIDETDVGLYPDKVKFTVSYEKQDGTVEEREENFLTHIIPEWAYLANNPTKVSSHYKGTLINFEELNRAPLAVRNAALQILNERRIGFRGFVFGNDVFMASTGNLGQEDDTDVEEFDSALKDRLIPVRHDMDYIEWRDTWASKNNNIHSGIVGFLNINPEYYYSKPNIDKKEDVFPTPRSWTFLSSMINKNFGIYDRENNTVIEEAPLSGEVLKFISLTGHYYIGNCNTQFVKYLHDVNKLTIWDVLGGELAKPEYRKGFVKFDKKVKDTIDRSKTSELLDKFKKLQIEKLKKEQIENLKLFVLSLNIEESASFYLKILDDDYEDINSEDTNPVIFDLLSDKRFRPLKEKLENSINSI
jgi:hypothetical protein